MGERGEVEQREVEGLRKEVFPFRTSPFPALAEEIHDHDLSQRAWMVRTIIILAFLFTSFFGPSSSVSQYMLIQSKTDAAADNYYFPLQVEATQSFRRCPLTSDALSHLLRLRVIISLSRPPAHPQWAYSTVTSSVITWKSLL
ncbi:hypothetical protein BJY00DRAFT_277134, partial [Aspergillus carlsbadensis]